MKRTVAGTALGAALAWGCGGDAGRPSGGPPAQQAAQVHLTVEVRGAGAGSVRLPDGNRCTGRCALEAARGALLRLEAAPAADSRFVRWEGACTGTGPCTVPMDADAQALALFEPQPQAQDAACTGLVPGPLGEGLQALLPQPGCLTGTSDGEGTFALGYEAGPGPTFPGVVFFAVRDGSASPVGETAFGGEEGPFALFAQPRGFTVYAANETSGFRTLRTYSHEGVLTTADVLTERPTPSSEASTVAVAADPAGGTLVARTRLTPEGMPRLSTLQRYAPDGSPVAGEAELAREADVLALGVSTSGHVLALASRQTPSGPRFEARWLTREGGPVTDWFEVGVPLQSPARAYALQPLVDGSLLLSVGTEPQHVLVFPDAQPRALPPPEWVQERSRAALFAIRGGRGYAAAGSAACGGGLEILTAAGNSCGCVRGADLGPSTTVGRDGSLIVPRQEPVQEQCAYRLYPGLLR